jgi:hypothetical protein
VLADRHGERKLLFAVRTDVFVVWHRLVKFQSSNVIPPRAEFDKPQIQAGSGGALAGMDPRRYGTFAEIGAGQEMAR